MEQLLGRVRAGRRTDRASFSVLVRVRSQRGVTVTLAARAHDPEGRIVAGQGFSLLFLPVPEGKVVKNRMHLDLLPTARSRDEEVERLLGIGATLVEDHRKADGAGWVTLADPEGNEFCVLRPKQSLIG